jgi:cell division protease FtsH
MFININVFGVFGLLKQSAVLLHKNNNQYNQRSQYSSQNRQDSQDSKLHMYNNFDVNLIHNKKFLFIKETYNDIIREITTKQIDKLYIDTDYKHIVTVDATPKNGFDDIIYNHYHYIETNPITLPNLISKATENSVDIHFVNFTPNNILNIQYFLSNAFNLVGNVLPVLFGLYILSNVFTMFTNPQRRMNSMNMYTNKNMNNNSPLSMFGNTDDKMLKGENLLNISLNSWAGSPEIIEECKEIISYLEQKEIYKKIGAEMPRGILLEGPPGTGKTLLAKAIASETNSTFISMSGSEFVELFVGMGAAKVRDLFASARANSPSIIFIDEIDAVGRQRGAGVNMGNDEREQTLNQILYEMDGFNNNENIVVIAATNRRDVLDQALLRPGRFDRIIKIPVPDKSSRVKILQYYLDSKPLEKPFNISNIAELSEGFSGAQLKNLVNEAAIMSVKNNYTKIQERYVYDSFEKLVVGIIKRNATTSETTRTRVAIHEAGHALLAIKFNQYFDFKKVSIQPTYNGAGGYTLFTEKPEIKEGGLYTKDILKKRLIVAMGGKAAEYICYGREHVSVGAIEDLNTANKLAKRMIGNFGMGDKLEVFYNDDVDDNPFLGKSLALGGKYSERTKYIMDEESLNLVREAYNEAKQILYTNIDSLLLFSELLKKNTILYDTDVIHYNYIVYNGVLECWLPGGGGGQLGTL